MTLEGEFVIDKILKGPRSTDRKYLVSWEGYSSKDNTWEPKKNLPKDFEKFMSQTPDESGNDQPLEEQLQPDPLVESVTPKQYVSPVVIPQRRSRIEPTVAVRTTFDSNRTGLRLRQGRK